MRDRIRAAVEIALVTEGLVERQSLDITRMRIKLVCRRQKLVVRLPHLVGDHLGEKIADVVRRGPGRLVAVCNRHLASRHQRIVQRDELGEGRGHGESVLLEDRLVVDHVLAVDVHGDSELLALELERFQRGCGESALPFGARQRLGQVERAALAGELAAELARPGKVDVRHLIGCHKHPDLVLVGLVRHRLHHDVDAGVGGLELGHRGIEIGHVLGLRELVQEADHGLVLRQRRQGCQDAGRKRGHGKKMLHRTLPRWLARLYQ